MHKVKKYKSSFFIYRFHTMQQVHLHFILRIKDSILYNVSILVCVCVHAGCMYVCIVSLFIPVIKNVFYLTKFLYSLAEQSDDYFQVGYPCFIHFTDQTLRVLSLTKLIIHVKKNKLVSLHFFYSF